MDKTKTILITILAILIFGIPIRLGNSYTHILVIYTAGENSIRANEINRGMELYLDNPAKSNREFADAVLFERYYLNMEDNPSSQKCEIYLRETKKLQDIIEEKNLGLVILSGDMAQRLIGIRLVMPDPANENYLKNNINWLSKQGNCDDKDGRNLKNKLQETITPLTLNNTPKIVFTGVTAADVKEYGYYEHPDMAGIYQRIYIPAVKEAIEDLYGGIPEEPNGKPTSIIVVGDTPSITNTDTGQLKDELSALTVPLKWDGVKEANTWEKWQDIIRAANKNNSMIFIVGYDNIGDQPARSVIRWTEDCAKFPVLGGTESFIDDGGVLTITISNQEQGAAALDLTRQLLANPAAENIPFIISNQFTIGVNNKLLAEKQIQLPPMYESFSRLSNTFNEDSITNIQTDCE